MTHITTNGTTKVVLDVRGADELQAVINKGVAYVKETSDDFNGASKIIVNAIKNDFDISEFGVYEINELAIFIMRISDYDNYTFSEYAYMYTSILDEINENK